eukprot:SRR837773.26022.p2 GENE.SRR837773.26022~~SRR837773.26022.p2  ORF type:complete len:123 (+),score=44.57 SRR837773.26022:24-371(+)
MGQVIQRRLFVFVFAGEDCVMDDKDEQMMRAYNAMLAQRIWEKSKSWRHFAAAMLTFNDFHLQRLVLNSSHTSTNTPRSTLSEIQRVQSSGFNWSWRPWQAQQKPEARLPSLRGR